MQLIALVYAAMQGFIFTVVLPSYAIGMEISKLFEMFM